jgi:hypothetical protein
MLYIPQELRHNASQTERMKAMQAARQEFYHIVTKRDGTPTHLMLTIGELIDIREAPYGTYLFPKHWANPRVGFLADAEMAKRIQKRFRTELKFGVDFAHAGVKMIMIGTLSVDDSYAPRLHHLSLINTTKQYIPFETIEEMELIDEMIASGRSFYKGLRYNVPLSKPMAVLTATDTGDTATAMYITAPRASEEYRALQSKMIAESEQGSWVWNPVESPMPDLPSHNVNNLMMHAGVRMMQKAQ